MKVLLIEFCNYIDYPIGGHLSFARNILKSFKSDISIVGISTEFSDKKNVGHWLDVEIDGINVKAFYVAIKNRTSKRPFIPARLSSFFLMRKWRNKIFEDSDYDVIIIQTPEILFSLPSELLRKVCVILPGIENPLKYSRYKIARLFANLFLKILYEKIGKVRLVLANSNQSSIDNFIKGSHNKVSSSTIIQFPTRYNENYFHRYQNKMELRNQLSLPSNATIYVTVGRLAQFKGIEFLLESFSKVKEQNKLFLIIGDGEYRNEIESYISNHKINNVILLGQLTPDKIGLYLGAADVFVMGSYIEGWSTALVEAVATALPAVVTDFSSAEEMVDDGINGYVVKSRDSDEFAEKMLLAKKIDTQILSNYSNNIVDLSVGKLRESLIQIFVKYFECGDEKVTSN